MNSVKRWPGCESYQMSWPMRQIRFTPETESVFKADFRHSHQSGTSGIHVAACRIYSGRSLRMKLSTVAAPGGGRASGHSPLRRLIEIRNGL